jgi:hypothetical protein
MNRFLLFFGIGMLILVACKQTYKIYDATNTGILTFYGKSYHVIPWEGSTP